MLRDKSRLVGLVLAAKLVLASAVASAAPVLRPSTVMSADGEAQMVLAAQKACRALGYRVAVALADRHGVIRALLTDDGVGPLDIASATHKAKAAGVTGFPTAFLAKAAKEAPAYVDLVKSVDQDVTFIGGGLPVRWEGQVLGGLGIGGAPNGEADEQCGQAALALLPKSGG